MNVLDRFLKYVRINSASSETISDTPSTKCQFDLAKILVEELNSIGLDEVILDDCCYVYAILRPSKGLEESRRIGLVAHLDTIPDFSGENVNPQIFENYDGQDVQLGSSGKIIETLKFPHLKDLKGHTLITTDGTTILGADDKAGIAEIITALETVIANNIPHGEIAICFMPDEEVYASTEKMNISMFDVYCAYSIDGNELGELVYENFNACLARFYIKGFNIHTGIAKGVLINAALVAIEINESLPSDEVPSKTEGYEGFFHLVRIEGTEEKAYLEYLVRDHEIKRYNLKQQLLIDIKARFNEKYGVGTVTLKISEQYQNMANSIDKNSDIIQNVIAATSENGLKTIIRPLRGSSTGAKFSAMGIVCPNLGVGGFAYHGPYEHITKEDMERVVDIITSLIRIFTETRDDFR